jgi:hypothetical protein
MAVELGISLGSVVAVLKDAELKPYRATDVQYLTEADFEKRYIIALVPILSLQLTFTNKSSIKTG